MVIEVVGCKGEDVIVRNIATIASCVIKVMNASCEMNLNKIMYLMNISLYVVTPERKWQKGTTF